MAAGLASRRTGNRARGRHHPQRWDAARVATGPVGSPPLFSVGQGGNDVVRPSIMNPLWREAVPPRISQRRWYVVWPISPPSSWERARSLCAEAGMPRPRNRIQVRRGARSRRTDPHPSGLGSGRWRRGARLWSEGGREKERAAQRSPPRITPLAVRRRGTRLHAAATRARRLWRELEAASGRADRTASAAAGRTIFLASLGDPLSASRSWAEIRKCLTARW